MKCPKCGTTLAKSNDGKYLCTPECKSIYDEKDLEENKIYQTTYPDGSFIPAKLELNRN